MEKKTSIIWFSIYVWVAAHIFSQEFVFLLFWPLFCIIHFRKILLRRLACFGQVWKSNPCPNVLASELASMEKIFLKNATHEPSKTYCTYSQIRSKACIRIKIITRTNFTVSDKAMKTAMVEKWWSCRRELSILYPVTSWRKSECGSKENCICYPSNGNKTWIEVIFLNKTYLQLLTVMHNWKL